MEPNASDLSVIASSRLFQQVKEDDVRAMLHCLDAHERAFRAGEYIFRTGDRPKCMGLIIEGSVRIEHVDYWGNRTIVATFGPGQSFAEVYACQPAQRFDVDAVAARDCRVLMLDVLRIISTCSSACAHHTQVVFSLLRIVTERTRALTRRIDHLSKRSTRAKLLAYFSDFAAQTKRSTFIIPHDRQELADYLAVDRSAMCSELSRMKREGLIDYHKNTIELKEGALP